MSETLGQELVRLTDENTKLKHLVGSVVNLCDKKDGGYFRNELNHELKEWLLEARIICTV